MREKPNILFIAWDNPASNYLEGLFLPIFSGLSAAYPYSVHFIQFSWADKNRIDYLTRVCGENNIRYNHFTVSLKPIASIGKYLTLQKGSRFIGEYIKENHIDIVIPRSTMPAQMVLKLGSWENFKVVFDADGLPVEERVDFAGLKPGSLRYRTLKGIERRIVTKANAILVRTRLAAKHLSEQHQVSADKFFLVINGRNESLFNRREESVSAGIRAQLGISSTSLVVVYAGSLGPQYGVEQMLYISRKLAEKNPAAVFLVLTNNPDYILSRKSEVDGNIVVRKVSFDQMPDYLSVANVALAIRQSSFSMRGVSPIKIGEYLLMGIPVVASTGIGDTDEQLAGREFAFLLESYEKEDLDRAVEWILSGAFGPGTSQTARAFALDHYSLQKSVASYRNALMKLQR